MTLAMNKIVCDLAAKVLRGEHIDEIDIQNAFDALSPMERKMLAIEGLQFELDAIVDADPTLESFEGEDGEVRIRRKSA